MNKEQEYPEKTRKFNSGFDAGYNLREKEIMNLINHFKPTKSNMVYDEVLEELIKQIKEKN